MKKINREEVGQLGSGMIVIAVFPDGKKKSFRTTGLPVGMSTMCRREEQLKGFPPEVEKFLYPTLEELTNLLDSALNV